MKTYPALVVRGIDPDLLAALVDDFAPSAIEPRDDDVRVFFTSAGDRDAAQRALAAAREAAAVDVSDEDWARRSQESLQPTTVGALTVFPGPPSAILNPHSTILNAPSAILNPHSAMSIVIRPSMGFGTGHHATTRLCLAALQTIEVRDRTVLDVGTGSGVLAIAAVLLGAARAIGVDSDADALQSARENLELNPAARDRVTFSNIDLMAAPLPLADIVTANLTGALLVRSATRLAGAVAPGGVLVVSGLLAHERDDVCRAFAGLPIVWEREEDGWAGLAVKKS